MFQFSIQWQKLTFTCFSRHMLVEATSFAHTVSVKLKSSWKPFELASCGSQILNKKTQLNCLSQLNRIYIYTFLSSNFCKPTLDMTAKPEVSFLVLPISKGLKSSFMRGEALSWEKKENKSMEKRFQKPVSKPTFPLILNNDMSSNILFSQELCM